MKMGLDGEARGEFAIEIAEDKKSRDIVSNFLIQVSAVVHNFTP